MLHVLLLVVSAMTCCELVSGAPPRQKTATTRPSQERQMELVFNTLCDNLHAVFDDDAATEFLNRTLDETLTLVENKPLLNTINTGYRILAEKLADKKMTKHMLSALTVVDQMFTNAEYHKLLKDNIQLYYMLVSNPAAAEMTGRLLGTLKSMKSDHVKRNVGNVVNHLLQAGEMQKTLDRLASGVQFFAATITNPGAKELIVKALNWVDGPKTNTQQTNAPVRTISVRPRHGYQRQLTRRHQPTNE